jgi:type I restriction-modification system DNA methylase subunit
MTNKSLFHKPAVQSLHADLLRANTESAKKERFLQYLSVEFAGDSAAQSLISKLTLGAEKVIANITRGGRQARGRADSQSETAIIEWEKDLTRTGEHAREQLEEYLEGNWRSGNEYQFVLIATDGIRWKQYAPDWSTATGGGFELGQKFRLKETRSFQLTQDTFEEFPFFLDEILFGSQPRVATLESIRFDFGDTSRVFINSINCLTKAAQDIEKQSELKVAFEQWRRFLSVAYGKFDDSPGMFLVHTYLSVFAKFIAYSVLAKQPIEGDETIKSILSGSAFHKLNIERFVEDDFFHWVGADGHFDELRPMFRQLRSVLADYDFTNVQEDVLKGVYQELIDLETRHALGEYYTPDWLCERVVSALDLKKSSRVLDPACGSGSFLRAVIARMRSMGDLTATELADQVVGIDIHPLSVQITKTTLLLSLGDLVRNARHPVTLNVFLANSLLVPRGTADLFASNFRISIDNRDYVIDLKGLEGPGTFDSLITFCDDMVANDASPRPIPEARFTGAVHGLLPPEHARELPGQLYQIYKGMKKASVEGRDSIWKFILQNSYKPVFLSQRFDFVVGNPPWLTYASITNEEYQKHMMRISDDYGLLPKSQANNPHIEIAAIFVAHSTNYFLKPNGHLAFVLPRSFLSADHHHNTRSGGVEGVRIFGIWDLDEVSPVFRVPTCVLFATRSLDNETKRRPEPGGIAGLVLAGRLPKSQVHWKDAEPFLTSHSVRWHYTVLEHKKSIRSAFSLKPQEAFLGSNAYEDKFAQGATIVPRNFFFVDLAQDVKDGMPLRERVLAIKTAQASDREAKAPWKGIKLEGRAEGQLLYRTAISKNIVPFVMVAPPLVALPVLYDSAAGKYQVVTASRLLSAKCRYGNKWFLKAEEAWETHRTQRNGGTTLAAYLNHLNKLNSQDPKTKFLVLYTSSATDASAAVVRQHELDLPFVVDHKTYWCAFETELEAHYVCAFLNSGFANRKIKDFQSRGLYGPRDIHKLILKIPLPKFKAQSPDHEGLATLGAACAIEAELLVSKMNVADMKPTVLGVVRSELRKVLAPKLARIDEHVERLATGSQQSLRSSLKPRGRKRNEEGDLFE